MCYNLEILEKRMRAYNLRKGARVGDFVKLPDCSYLRIVDELAASNEGTSLTFNEGDEICLGQEGSAFYLGSDFIQYTGDFEFIVVRRCDLLPLKEVKSGCVWFFDGDLQGPARRSDFAVDFRVFSLRLEAKTSGLPNFG